MARPPNDRGQGRKPGFRMSDEHRQKIANSAVLQHLIEHATSQREMSTSAVTAAIALLRKVLPDLQAVQHTGDEGGPVVMKVVLGGDT